jgi:hypothetical protein
MRVTRLFMHEHKPCNGIESEGNSANSISHVLRCLELLWMYPTYQKILGNRTNPNGRIFISRIGNFSIIWQTLIQAVTWCYSRTKTHSTQHCHESDTNQTRITNQTQFIVSRIRNWQHDRPEWNRLSTGKRIFQPRPRNRIPQCHVVLSILLFSFVHSRIFLFIYFFCTGIKQILYTGKTLPSTSEKRRSDVKKNHQHLRCVHTATNAAFHCSPVALRSVTLR